MPRLMSVAYTEQAVRERRKTVTRRLGWHALEPGTELDLCRKVPSGRFRPMTVDPLVRIARVRVLSTRWEPLYLITREDVYREGFDEQSPLPGVDGDSLTMRFIRFFTSAMRCYPTQSVNRIEWEYLPTPTDWPVL